MGFHNNLIAMGRKSIAEHILDDLKEDEDKEGLYLVLYDFDRTFNQVIPPKFFKNLNRLMAKLPLERLQYSVLISKSLNAARAVMRLAKRYNATSVCIYKVEEMLDEY